MEAPAGLVLIEYKQEGKKVSSVKLTNVPAYLAAENITVECPDLGSLKSGCILWRELLCHRRSAGKLQGFGKLYG